MSQKKRVELYDVLRVIAIILVVLGHSQYYDIGQFGSAITYQLPSDINSAWNDKILAWFRSLSGWVYSFHMPLFFMLSGAVLRLKPMVKFDDFIISKAKRLLMPYFAAGVFFMIPIKRLSDFYTSDNLWTGISIFLSYGQTGHLWFLITLFWCMLVFYMIHKINEQYLGDYDTNLILISLLLYLVGNDLINFDFFGFKSTFSYLIWFNIGYVFENVRKNIDLNISVYEGIGICIILGSLEYFDWERNYFNIFFKIICGSIFILSISYVISKFYHKIIETKIFKIMLEYSFMVYLLHDSLNYFVLKIWFNYGFLHTVWGCYMYSFMRFFGLYTICILIAILLKRIRLVVMRKYQFI